MGYVRRFSGINTDFNTRLDEIAWMCVLYVHDEILKRSLYLKVLKSL